MEEKKCRYCGNFYQKTGKGEHVFPYGLGGENLYMNCVCDNCNNYFSTLERELLQKSLIGMMRSTEGIEGYKPSKEKPAPFKAPLLLMEDDKTGIVYEVGQFYQMQIFIRPQVICIDGKYYLETDTNEGRVKLFEKYKNWKTTNLRIIVRMPISKQDSIGFIQFVNLNDHYSSEMKEERIIIRDEIFFEPLAVSHNLYEKLTPRLFIDDDDRLRIRARTLEEAIVFIEKFLKLTLQQVILYSYGGEDIYQPVISVGYSFDVFKTEQALVKIGINCLLYYYPTIQNDTALNDSISFVKNGLPLIQRSVDTKSQIIDSCEDTHNIFFYQTENSTCIRISLFNGGFVFAFYVLNLKIFQRHEYNRLIIDYKNRVNKFEDMSTFLNSFNIKGK